MTNESDVADRGAYLGSKMPAVATGPAASYGANAPKEDDGKAILLEYAAAEIHKGKAQGAIDEYLDPVITYYHQTYGSTSYKVYCSSSPNEALMYMLMSLKTKQPAVALHSTWCDAVFLKAYALINLGRPDEAKPLIEEAIAHAPSNSHYLSELGNWYQQKKDWPNALGTFSRALEAAPLMPAEVQKAEKGRALRGTGYSLSELGRYDEAEDAYHNALTLDPNDKVAQAELVYIAHKRGKGSPIKS